MSSTAPVASPRVSQNIEVEVFADLELGVIDDGPPAALVAVVAPSSHEAPDRDHRWHNDDDNRQDEGNAITQLLGEELSMILN